MLALCRQQLAVVAVVEVTRLTAGASVLVADQVVEVPQVRLAVRALLGKEIRVVAAQAKVGVAVVAALAAMVRVVARVTAALAGPERLLLLQVLL